MVIGFVVSIISKIGYPGIFFLMVLEGMLLPIPSEVVMLFGGYLAQSGGLPAYAGLPSVFWVLLSGTAGNIFGALLAYYIGKLGGVALLLRYGKYFMIDERSIQRAQAYFDKYGGRSVFATRLIPVFRTFISIPAGIGKMNVLRFAAYTGAGTIIWNLLLVYLGMLLNRSWETLIPFFDYLTYAALVVIAILAIIWGRAALKKYRKKHSEAFPLN